MKFETKSGCEEKKSSASTDFAYRSGTFSNVNSHFVRGPLNKLSDMEISRHNAMALLVGSLLSCVKTGVDHPGLLFTTLPMRQLELTS